MSPSSQATEFAKQIEFAFTLLFTAELVIKAAAMGFYGHSHAYLASYWNCLDFAGLWVAGPRSVSKVNVRNA